MLMRGVLRNRSIMRATTMPMAMMATNRPMLMLNYNFSRFQFSTTPIDSSDDEADILYESS